MCVPGFSMMRRAALRQMAASWRSRLAGIAGYDMLHDGLRDFDLLLRQAVFGQHFGQQVAQSDIDLLIEHIAGQVDDVHAVGQGAWNLVFHVAGADEKYL